MRRYLPFIIISIVLLAVIGAVVYSFRSAIPKPNHVTNGFTTNTYAGAPGAEPPHIRGAYGDPPAANSKVVTLEEFGDFQCPPCGALYPDLKKIETDYGARLRVVFREFPLATMHKNAFDAARAAEAAGFQGRFWEMHDKLYENQSEWSNATPARPVFINFARALGLDPERFTRDMDGQLSSSRILLDMRRGDSLGVKGTPTVFIDSQEVKASDMTPQALRAAIDTALANQSGK
jgi:protein-disulfide isomerase